MTNHKVTYTGSRAYSQAKCSCERRSPVGTRDECEMWFLAHVQEIERIRARLGSRNVSLKTQHAWYVEQAENKDNTPEDRVLWQQLADEMGHFLKSKEPAPLEQDMLFEA